MCPFSSGIEHDEIVLHEFFNRLLTRPQLLIRFAEFGKDGEVFEG